MMDSAVLDDSAHAPARTAEVEAPLRAARESDIDLVHSRLIEAITASPYYSDEFKAYETARLGKPWLTALLDADPWHIAIMQLKGETAGFMISAPDLGTLWLHWSYVFPEKRKSGMALLAMRTFLSHWQHDRFHKVATYTRPGNDAAAAIMERYGWTLTATLRQHVFGEDYLLYEHPLEKSIPGYDHGLAFGRPA
jgi:RimJ/RimL family protein N-acetyltransferase